MSRDWLEEALCATAGIDPELFFPGKGGTPKEAKKICAACPVARECLDDAIAYGDRHGVRGGLSREERNRIPQNERVKRITPQDSRAQRVLASRKRGASTATIARQEGISERAVYRVIEGASCPS